MKRFCCTALCVLLSLILNAQGAYQRIAFAPLNLAISAGGKSSPVKWYCYDQLRLPPAGFSKYNQVQFDGGALVQIGQAAPITLQDAFNKGLIELAEEGDDAFAIVNKTNEQIIAKSDRPGLVGRHKGDAEGRNANALNVVTQSAADIQEKLWKQRRELEVFEAEGYLPGGAVSDQTALKKAELDFRKKNNIKTDDAFDGLISAKYHNLKSVEKTRREKTIVYLYQDLISNSNPSSSDLKKADQLYKNNKNLADDDVEWALSEELDDINRRQDWLAHEGYLTPDDELTVDVNLLKAAEKKYQADLNFPDIKTVRDLLVKNYEDHYEQYSELYIFLERFQGDAKDNIRSIQQAFGVPQTGYLKTGPEADAFQEYLKITRLTEDTDDIHQYITNLKKLKTDLGLSNNLALSPPERVRLEEIMELIEKDDHLLVSGIYHNNHLYVVRQDIDYAMSACKLDVSNLTLINETPLGYQRGLFLDKLESDVYVLNNNIVPVSKLYSKLDAYASEKQYLTFGKGMKHADVKNFISTAKIKTITGKGIDFLEKFEVNAKNFDFSGTPIVADAETYYDDMKDLTVSITGNTREEAGPGFIGNLKVVLEEVPEEKISGFKGRLLNLYKKLTGNHKLNFATELRKDLSTNGISTDRINSTFSKIEVVKTGDGSIIIYAFAR